MAGVSVAGVSVAGVSGGRLEAEGFVAVHHVAQLAADVLGPGDKVCGGLGGQVAAVTRGFEPMKGLLEFSVGVGEFREEVSWIAPLRPSLRDAGADRTR